MERAIKYYMIAVRDGLSESSNNIKVLYRYGNQHEMQRSAFGVVLFCTIVWYKLEEKTREGESEMGI